MWDRDAQRAAHALDRYLQGVRVSAIAAELSLSPSTVRRWITAQLQSIAADERAARVEQLQAAIESQRAIAREAWVAYHREQTLEDRRLSGELDRPRRASGSDDDRERPQRANHAATFLRIAGTAQREVARLQGLYTSQQSPTDHVKITITRHEPGPENMPPADLLPDTTPDTPPGFTPDTTCAAPADTHTSQLVQTAQLSTTQEARSAESPSPRRGDPTGARGVGVRSVPAAQRPCSSDQPQPGVTHRQRKRLAYLQSQHQSAHQLRWGAYSGP